MICLSYNKIRPIALGYAFLPLLLFLLFWTRPVYAACFSALAVLAYKKAVLRPHIMPSFSFLSPMESLGRNTSSREKDATSNDQICSTRGFFAAMALIALVWCIFSGQGGLWYQSPDWEVRNAILTDLITHPWPVFYQNSSVALSYYVGFWLPVGAICHLLFKLGVSTTLVIPLSNILLLIWSTIGVFLVELLIVVTLKISDFRSAVFLILLFIFFSTPDVMGVLIGRTWNMVLSSMHMENWPNKWGAVGQFSSITTCLFWVFNQAIVSWICILCFLNERTFERYFFIWACCFNCGPFPSVGLAILMLAQGIKELFIHAKDDGSPSGIVKSVFSDINLLSVSVALVPALYFSSNSMVASSEAVAKVASSNLLPAPLWFPSFIGDLKFLLAFLAIEGLLLPLILFSSYKQSSLYWGMLVIFVACPFIRVGGGIDFCMRVSMPAVLVLYVLSAHFIYKNIISYAKGSAVQKQKKRLAAILCFFLLVGAATPALELYRGFYNVFCNGIAGSLENKKDTLEYEDYTFSNFGTRNPENTLFFKYLSQ